MIRWRQSRRRDKIIRQLRRLAELGLELAIGIIADRFFPPAAVRHDDVAAIGKGKHGLQPRGDIIGEDRNGSRRRDGGQQSVADAMFGNSRADIVIKLSHACPGQIGRRLEQGERPLFPGQIHAGQIGRPAHRGQPAFGQSHGLIGAIAHPAKDQGIRQPGHAQADPPFRLRLVPLGRQGKIGDVDGIVQHPHGHRHQTAQLVQIQLRPRAKRIAHQTGQIDRTEQTGAIGG